MSFVGISDRMSLTRRLSQRLDSANHAIGHAEERSDLDLQVLIAHESGWWIAGQGLSTDMGHAARARCDLAKR